MRRFSDGNENGIFSKNMCMLGVLNATCIVVGDVVSIINQLLYYVIVTKESNNLDTISSV